MNMEESTRGQASGSESVTGAEPLSPQCTEGGALQTQGSPRTGTGHRRAWGGVGTRPQAAAVLGGTVGFGQQPCWAGAQWPGAPLQRRVAGQGALSPPSLDSGA